VDHVIRRTALCWAVAVMALIAAGAGVSSLAGGMSDTSIGRMALAAGVLSAYTAAAGLVVTRRTERTRLRCLLWGGTVPILVGLLNAALVTPRAGLLAGLVSALPWLAGALLMVALGPFLPAIRLPSWARRPLHSRP
jgi:hypothetical protein